MRKSLPFFPRVQNRGFLARSIRLTSTKRHYTVQLAGLAHRPPTAQAATPLPGTYPVPVIVDSGTTLSLLPQDLVDALAAQFPGAESDGQGGYRVPCTYRTQPGTVVFTLAGTNTSAPVIVRVTYADFIWDSGRDCYLGAWNDPAVGVYILGDTFLRGAYVVFDQESDALFIADYVPCGGGASDLVPVPAGPDQAALIPGNCVPAGGAGGGGGAGSEPTSSASLASGAPSSSVTALDPSANPPGPVSVSSSSVTFLPTTSVSSTSSGSSGLSSTTSIPSTFANTPQSSPSPSGTVTASASGLGVDRNAVPADGSGSSSSGGVARVTTRSTITSTITNRIVYTVTACPPSDAGCTVGQLATSTAVRTTTFCPEMAPTPGPALPPGVAPAPGAAGGGGGGAVIVTVQEQCHTSTFAVTSCAPDASAACTVGMTTTATYTQYRTVTAPAVAAAAVTTGADYTAGAPAVPPVAQVGAAPGPGPAAGQQPSGAPYGNETTTSGTAGETPETDGDVDSLASGNIAGDGSESVDFPSVVAIFPAGATDRIRGTGTGTGLSGNAAATGLVVVAGAGRTGGTTMAWAVGLGAVLVGGAVGLV